MSAPPNADVGLKLDNEGGKVWLLALAAKTGHTYLFKKLNGLERFDLAG
ncbi:hypothetical protein [Alkalinema pantanalense]